MALPAFVVHAVATRFPVPRRRRRPEIVGVLAEVVDDPTNQVAAAAQSYHCRCHLVEKVVVEVETVTTWTTSKLVIPLHHHRNCRSIAPELNPAVSF